MLLKNIYNAYISCQARVFSRHCYGMIIRPYCFFEKIPMFFKGYSNVFQEYSNVFQEIFQCFSKIFQFFSRIFQHTSIPYFQQTLSDCVESSLDKTLPLHILCPAIKWPCVVLPIPGHL